MCAEAGEPYGQCPLHLQNDLLDPRPARRTQASSSDLATLAEGLAVGRAALGKALGGKDGGSASAGAAAGVGSGATVASLLEVRAAVWGGGVWRGGWAVVGQVEECGGANRGVCVCGPRPA